MIRKLFVLLFLPFCVHICSGRHHTLHKPVIWLLPFCTYRIHTVPLFSFFFLLSLSLSRLQLPFAAHILLRTSIHCSSFISICLFVCFPLCCTHTIRTCMPIASSAPALLYHYHCFCPSSCPVACILYAFLLSFVGIPECTSMHGCRQLVAFYFEYRSIAMDFLSYCFSQAHRFVNDSSFVDTEHVVSISDSRLLKSQDCKLEGSINLNIKHRKIW